MWVLGVITFTRRERGSLPLQELTSIFLFPTSLQHAYPFLQCGKVRRVFPAKRLSREPLAHAVREAADEGQRGRVVRDSTPVPDRRRGRKERQAKVGQGLDGCRACHGMRGLRHILVRTQVRDQDV